jgi:hypothetical protein
MHDNALTEEGSRLFPLLSKFEGFYLVGGTALSLQIGHRLSVDFDMFSVEPLAGRLLERVKKVFAPTSIIVTYRAPDQLSLTINDIKATFFHYPYPVVNPLVEYRGVELANIGEIAAMKAFAIGKRLAYKDYVDWYFLLKEKHVSLAEVITIAEKKYGGDFNDRLFLGQLVSFDDIPTQKIEFLRDFVDRETIIQFLTQEVRDFKL